MATVLLIGTDAALLEGLAQALATTGHRATMVRAVRDAADAVRRGDAPVRSDRPLVVLLEREQAGDGLQAASLLAAGGALVLYHATAAAGEAPLPAPLRRLTLADLALPLERHRLLTIIDAVQARAEATGRTSTPPAEERRAQ
jgi:DNA-binding NtrC family response regulator